MWRVSYFARVQIGIALLSLVVLNCAVRQSASTLFRSGSLKQTHYITQYEQRFAELHRVLPPKQTILYIDDFDESADQCDAFYMAQYSLTPAVLVALGSNCGSAAASPSKNPRMMLENFHDPYTEPYLLNLFPIRYFDAHEHHGEFTNASLRSVLVRDFGHGVRLYTMPDK